MIVAIGGMERSATNYCNYVWFLNRDLKVVNYPTPKEVFGGMNHRHIAHLHKHPFLVPDAISDSLTLVEYHRRQLEKKEFKGVCFKYDRGEEWYKDVLHRLSCPVLFVYCIRPLYRVVDSWMRWLGPTYKPFKLTVALSKSLSAVSSIPVVRRCFDATQGMEYHREWFRKRHEEMGLTLGDEQKLFLEERRRVNGDGTSTGLSEAQLLEPLYSADPPLTNELLHKYNSLLQEARDV